jgi:hypothetical protein
MRKKEEDVMAIRNETPNDEAVVLVNAVENLFRKLARFLIGRMSLVSLQEIIKYVFVEEIENKLRAERPERNVALTELALLSGLDTRTLTRIRNSSHYRRPFCEERNFLSELAPGALILDIWSSTPPYVDKDSGGPITLPISGKSPSFESLFREYGKGRGVTYNSLLERLVESGAVLRNKDNEVQLVAKSYLPSRANDRRGAIEMGFAALGNMVDTVTNNIDALGTEQERLYQRGAWTYRLNKCLKSQLRAELRSLLERTDLEARGLIEKYEDTFASPDQITAGISLFYFEESTKH